MIVGIEPESLEVVRMREGYSSKGCWYKPVALREGAVRKARRNGLDTTP